MEVQNHDKAGTSSPHRLCGLCGLDYNDVTGQNSAVCAKRLDTQEHRARSTLGRLMPAQFQVLYS